MSTPQDARIAALRSERHDVSVLGGAAAYWTYGPPDAETVVIAVHGFRGDHHGMELILSYLPDVRVIAPDLPGFGATAPLHGRTHNLATYVEWLTEFAAAVAPGATILGHSFGSIVTSAAVAEGLATPQLILINPIGAPALEGPKGILTRLAVSYYDLGAKLPERLGTALLRNRAIVRLMSIAMVKSRDRNVRRFAHHQHDLYFAGFADRNVLRDAFVASVSHDVRAAAPKIAQPTLLVAAVKDDITPIEAERHLATLFPDARLHEIDDVGHLIHYETPAHAADAIMTFLTPRDVPSPAGPQHEME